MILFLKIVAGCLLAIVVVICAVLYYAKRQFIQFLNEEAHSASPLVLHLNEEIDPEWVKSDDAIRIAGELASLGFSPGKSYLADKVHNVSVWSFFNNEYCAVIYNMPNGVFSEVAFRGIDKQDFTFSNQPFAGMTDTPPHKTCVPMPDATATQLYEAILLETKDIPGVRITDKTFRQAVEASYREDIMFMNAGGGVTREQFESMATALGENPTVEHIDEAFELQKTTELESWNEAALEVHYESFSNDNLHEYYDNQYFIVPKICNRRALLNHLADVDLLDEDDVERVDAALTDIETPALFDHINQGRSPDLRAVHVKTVEFPVEAELYKIAA